MYQWVRQFVTIRPTLRFMLKTNYPSSNTVRVRLADWIPGLEDPLE